MRFLTKSINERKDAAGRTADRSTFTQNSNSFNGYVKVLVNSL